MKPPSAFLRWVLGLLAATLMAGVLGFSGMAGTAAGAAQVLFYLCAFALAVSALVGLIHGSDDGHFQ